MVLALNKTVRVFLFSGAAITFLTIQTCVGFYFTRWQVNSGRIIVPASVAVVVDNLLNFPQAFLV